MSQSERITPPANIAVIGLGNMGQPMAACIARAGFTVVGRFDKNHDFHCRSPGWGLSLQGRPGDAPADNGEKNIWPEVAVGYGFFACVTVWDFFGTQWRGSEGC